MLGPQSADRDPGDESRDSQPRVGNYLIPAGMRQRDLYVPLFLEFANFDARTRALLETNLPGCPWEIISEYLLPCMQAEETFEAITILQYASALELPMISQTQRFFLTPPGNAVEVENRIVVAGASDSYGQQINPSIHIIKSGIDDGAFSARVEFSKQGPAERWAIVDTIMQSFSKISPSEQLSESSQNGLRVSMVSPGISLGLVPLTLASPEWPDGSKDAARAERRMWAPQDVTVREPTYSDHRVIASHAFPERAREVITSGILPHLEAFAEQEKGLSRQRLARIAQGLEAPLRISVWRWYSPSMISSQGFDVGSSSGGDYASSENTMTDQILSMSEVMDPTEVVNSRSISFVAASAQSELYEERSRTRGRLRMEYHSPAHLPDESKDAELKYVNARWRDLLMLMRDLNLPATKKELLGLLRELEDRARKHDERVSAIRLTIQDPEDPEGQRAVSPRFARTKFS